MWLGLCFMVVGYANITVMESTINEEGKWRVIESEYLFRRPWLTARRDKVELPDGRIHPEYYVLEYPDWVNVIAITTDGQFVLERQYRHALGKTSYEIPCGVVEAGEELLYAAKRELMEETGFGGGQWEWFMSISPNPSSNSNMAHTFIATGVEKMSEQHLDATEDISVHLLSRDELFGLLSRGEIIQALMAAPLWKFFYQSK